MGEERDLATPLVAKRDWKLRFWTLKGGWHPTPPHNPPPQRILTLTGAETEFAVAVIVGCSTTPRRTIGAAICGASQIGASLEGEGKVTWGTICVPKVGGNHCSKETRVRATGHGPL